MVLVAVAQKTGEKKTDVNEVIKEQKRLFKHKRHTFKNNHKMTSNPIATSTASLTNTRTFSRRGTSSFSHSPVVMAMITNNRMSDCRDVNAMMQECLAKGSNDRVCQVASHYINMCTINEG